MTVAIVIPTLNTQSAIDQILTEIPGDLLDSVIIVDDGSEVPIHAENVCVIRHEQNKGYGAAQKTGYDAALKMGAERIILLHGDGQYNTEDVLGLIVPLAACDAAIGSRFLNQGAGQIPWWRRWGNRTLTMMANFRYSANISELHSGARAFRASVLQSLDYHRFSDDYIFDHQVWACLLSQGATIGERKVLCRYDDTVQSISVSRSIRYAAGVMRTIMRPPPEA